MKIVNEIKAIQTEYKGYLFRSKLEARWAVFFDTLGLPWFYESEGLDLDDVYYLPDFYLPKLKLWVEIKPGDTDEWLSDHPVFNYLDKHSDTEFLFVLLKGTPYCRLRWSGIPPSSLHDSVDVKMRHLLIHQGDDFEYMGYIKNDNCYYWCECPNCGYIGIQYEGRAGRLGCGCHINEKSRNTASPRLLQAYNAARKFRPDGRR